MPAVDGRHPRKMTKTSPKPAYATAAAAKAQLTRKWTKSFKSPSKQTMEVLMKEKNLSLDGLDVVKTPKKAFLKPFFEYCVERGVDFEIVEGTDGKLEIGEQTEFTIVEH